MVGPGRLELPTSRLSSARSNQLSYEPDPSGKRWNKRPYTAMPARVRGHLTERKGNEGGGKFRRVLRGCPNSLVREGLVALKFGTSILRKEVIQPQVPLRLPCYDFGPVADPTVASCLLAVSALS